MEDGKPKYDAVVTGSVRMILPMCPRGRMVMGRDASRRPAVRPLTFAQAVQVDDQVMRC